MFCTKFASTQDPEFVQGQSCDVPDRKLGLNISTATVLHIRIVEGQQVNKLDIC